MFDLERFIDNCEAVVSGDAGQNAVREIVARAVSDPSAVIAALGEPERAEVQLLSRSDQMTVLKVIWGPMMTFLPHNHRKWAVIGMYTGREDNVFWRRVGGEAGRSRIEAAGAKALFTKDAWPLGRDIIHSVTNPIPRLSAAIHVYGGDFHAPTHSEWDPETLLECPYDIDKVTRLFEQANVHRVI